VSSPTQVETERWRRKELRSRLVRGVAWTAGGTGLTLLSYAGWLPSWLAYILGEVRHYLFAVAAIFAVLTVVAYLDIRADSLAIPRAYKLAAIARLIAGIVFAAGAILISALALAILFWAAAALLFSDREWFQAWFGDTAFLATTAISLPLMGILTVAEFAHKRYRKGHQRDDALVESTLTAMIPAVLLYYAAGTAGPMFVLTVLAPLALGAQTWPIGHGALLARVSVAAAAIAVAAKYVHNRRHDPEWKSKSESLQSAAMSVVGYVLLGTIAAALLIFAVRLGLGIIRS
jgi:MFS family permease